MTRAPPLRQISKTVPTNCSARLRQHPARPSRPWPRRRWSSRPSCGLVREGAAWSNDILHGCRRDLIRVGGLPLGLRLQPPGQRGRVLFPSPRSATARRPAATTSVRARRARRWPALATKKTSPLQGRAPSLPSGVFGPRQRLRRPRVAANLNTTVQRSVLESEDVQTAATKALAGGGRVIGHHSKSVGSGMSASAGRAHPGRSWDVCAGDGPRSPLRPHPWRWRPKAAAGVGLRGRGRQGRGPKSLKRRQPGLCARPRPGSRRPTAAPPRTPGKTTCFATAAASSAALPLCVTGERGHLSLEP